MKRAKLIIGVTLIFTLGALAGALGTRVYVMNNHPLFKYSWSQRKAFVVNRLTRELALSDRQRDQIRRIIDRVGDQASDRFRQHHKEMEALLESGVQDVKAVLNPDQYDAFETFKQKMDDRRRRLLRRMLPK